ncbi:MAG: hypothetical protein ACI97K_000485 [Glaciecola sp.]|jgi:hypothetical protein
MGLTIPNKPMKLTFVPYILFYFLSISILTGCGGGSAADTPPIQQVQTPEINQFYFTVENNSSLSGDIQLQVDGDTITGRVPTNVSVETLIATFTHSGIEVTVNNALQTSDTTPNNFTQIQIYTVTTNDGQTKSFSVDLTKFTGLPIVRLTIEGGASVTSKDNYVNGEVWIDGGRNYVELITVPMKIRGRGNSTWGHPKKPYQMKLEDKSEFLGMPSDKKWLFLAEYSDKTMLRNTIAFEMGHMSNLSWTPQSVLSEVYLNNDYIGTYNIAQKVEESDNRLPLGDDGFLLEIDQFERLDSDDVYFNTDRFLINVKEPSIEWGSPELVEISTTIRDFEQTLFSSDFKQIDIGYRKHIDVESFIDWFLISEITKNVDSRSFSSIYLHVLPGEKIKMGPLWDFDLSFGNVDYADSRYPQGYWVKEHEWYERLFQDPAFVSQVQDRFAFFKENQSVILDKIDEYALQLQWAQQENDDRWQTIGIYVWPNPVVYDTYDEEVEHMKHWFTTRMNWLDDALNSL